MELGPKTDGTRMFYFLNSMFFYLKSTLKYFKIDVLVNIKAQNYYII